MKYIRTKDGRITTLKDELIENVELWVLGGKENILRITDTIEELCDEFVIKYFSNVREKYEYLHLETFKQLRHFHWEKDDEYYVYGAIWTDKGLIYVAKINENGELELL